MDENDVEVIPITKTYSLLYSSSGDRGCDFAEYILKHNKTNEELHICSICGEGILGEYYVVKGNKLYIGIGEQDYEEALSLYEVNLRTLTIHQHKWRVNGTDDADELNQQLKNHMKEIAQVELNDIQHIYTI